MPDMEKVIKALEYCVLSDDCRACEYWMEFDDTGCQIMKDALVLLKEQENNIDTLKTLILGYESGALLKDQEPKLVQSIREIAMRTYGYCPNCGRGLDSYHDGNSGEHITHFCYNCGQAVKWE